MPTIVRDAAYPCTIVPARYGGTYSGARWHAWALRPHNVPEAAYGSDRTCADFWGFGMTPREGSGLQEKETSELKIGDFLGSMRRLQMQSESDEYTVAKGSTPEEAHENLKQLIETD